MQRTIIKPTYSRLPLTDEDICAAYARQVTATVNSQQSLPGISHCMFLVLYASERRHFVRVSAPQSWCANGGEEDIYPVLAQCFRNCLARDFQLEDTELTDTLRAFSRAFVRRLREDEFDDRRIANTCVFLAHPEGSGILVSLKGVAFAKKYVAKELGIKL